MAEFIAFDRIDPWDENRADLRAGIVSSVIANVNRGRKAKAFRPMDFMPYAKVEADRKGLLKRRQGGENWPDWRKRVRGIFDNKKG